MMPLVFSYKIDDLLEEITKRTSYLGKMRGTEQEPFLLDRLSLTSGEDFMFSEFLDNAVNDTYDWVRAFGRKVGMYDKVMLKYNDTYMYKNYGCVITSTNIEQVSEGRYKIENCEFGNVQDDRFTALSGSITVKNQTDKDVEVECTYLVTVFSTIDGLPVSETVRISESDTASAKDSCAFVGLNVPFDSIEDAVLGIRHTINRVDVEVEVSLSPVEKTNIKGGTYVEYRTNLDDDTVFELYQTLEDCTNVDWMSHATKLEYDPRGAVTYILEKKEFFDENMIPSVSRSLKESIINNIIYQWYEYVNAPEAEHFYLKYEDAAQKAQIGMNARTKDVQRKYKLF